MSDRTGPSSSGDNRDERPARRAGSASRADSVEHSVDESPPAPMLNVRRIAIAGGVVIAIVLAGGAYIGIQYLRTTQRVAEKRRTGIELVQRYPTTQSQQDAIGLLGAAISWNPDDVDALLAYATASLRTPKPDGEHLLAASRAWSQALARNPAGHDDVRRKLVLLYDQLGESSRVLELVGPLFRTRPDDPTIARANAVALLRLGKNAAAAEAVAEWTKLEPESLAAQSARISAMRAANAADRDIDAYLDAQLKARPDSPALLLLKAQWLGQTGRAERGQQLFERVIARADQIAPDSDVAGQIVAMLDGSGRRRQATALLLDYISRADADPQLRGRASTRALHTLLALRAWDVGDHALAARVFGATEPFEVTPPPPQQAAASPTSASQPANAPVEAIALSTQPSPVARTLWPFPADPDNPTSESAIDSPELYESLIESARWHAYSALHASLIGDTAGHSRAMQRLDRLPPEFAEAWQTAIGVIRGTAQGTGDTEDERIRSLFRKFDRLFRRGARDPLVFAAVADLQLRQARPDDADRALADALNVPAGWSIAAQRLVQLRRSRGQVVQALDVARRSVLRSEWSLDHAIRLAQVLHDVEPRDAEQEKQLDSLVRMLQRVQPLEVNTLPMYVELLARKGEADEAKRQIEAALASDRVPPRTLVELATVSFAQKLGLEERLHERARQLQGGDTPDVLLAWARLEHAAGRTRAALARLDEKVAAAQSPQERRGWLEVRATFLAQIGAAEAAKAWTELADAHADDVPLQRRLLSLQNAVDAEAQRRAIDRLKKAAPDDPSWRIAAARLALTQNSPAPEAAALKQIASDMSAIVERRPEQLDARMLLVECLRRTGNNLAAVQQLERADEATPGQASILLLMAQLVFEQGDRTRAGELLSRLAKLNVPLAPAERFVAGQLYARLDRADAAIEQLQASRGASREGDRLLATLLYRVGRPEEAKRLLDTMLLDPDAETLLLAAGVAESRGDAAEATRHLDRLAALPAPESRKLLLLARYHLNMGRRDLAETLLTRAVYGSSSSSSSPSTTSPAEMAIDPAAPVEAQLLLVQLRIEQGRTDAGVAVLRAAAKAMPHEVAIANAALQADRILVAGRANAVPLAVSLLLDPTSPGPQALADFLARPPASAAAPSLRAEFAEVDRLAESYPEAFVVQLYCADQYLQRGQPLRAAAIANRLVARNPSDPAPARLAATALASAGEWRQCVSAIEGWRAKLPPGSTEPDAIEAISLARQGRHDEVLAKYLDRAKASPKSQPQDLLAGVAIALHAARRDSDAVELVWSAMSDDPRGISGWLEFAAQFVDPPASAAAWCDRVESSLSTQSTSALLRSVVVVARDRIADRAAESDPTLAAKLRDLAEREAIRIESMPDAPAPALVALTQRRVNRAAAATTSAQPDRARAELAIAEATYRAWMERSPQDWVVKNNFANLLMDAGRLDEAAPLIDAAIKAAPSEPAVIDSHATLLMKRHDYRAAQAEARRAVELQPRNPHWRLTLAEATWALNNKPAAQAELDVLKWHYREREYWPADQIERYLKLERAVNPSPPPATRRSTSRPTTSVTTAR